MYKVIRNFIDLQDHNHKYSVGDKFPRTGLKVSVKRVRELSSYQNKLHRPVIRYCKPKKENKTEVVEQVVKVEDVVIDKVEEKPIEVEKKLYTKTEILRMNKQTLVELAKTLEIDRAEELTVVLLKDAIIGRYGL